MRDSAIFTVTVYEAPLLPDEMEIASPSDALTAPSVDDLLPGGLALLPRGAAWGSPDRIAPSHASVFAGLMRWLLSPFADLYRRAAQLADESRVTTLFETLDDWERDFGLPDACAPADQSRTQRLRSLTTRVRSVATITPQDFIQLARGAGFEIEIVEPAVFECGFSQCGGEHECGPLGEEAFWIVRVLNLPVDYFRVGESEVGFDPLFRVDGAAQLVCLLSEVAPGWTMPIFEFPNDSDIWVDLTWVETDWGVPLPT